MPKNFVGEPFSVSLNSGIEKFYTSDGYVTFFDFLSKVYCFTVPKISQMNPFVLFFRNFPVAKKFMDKRWGVSRFSVGNFLPHSAYNFRRGIS